MQTVVQQQLLYRGKQFRRCVLTVVPMEGRVKFHGPQKISGAREYFVGQEVWQQVPKVFFLPFLNIFQRDNLLKMWFVSFCWAFIKIWWPLAGSEPHLKRSESWTQSSLLNLQEISIKVSCITTKHWGDTDAPATIATLFWFFRGKKKKANPSLFFKVMQFKKKQSSAYSSALNCESTAGCVNHGVHKSLYMLHNGALLCLCNCFYK